MKTKFLVLLGGFLMSIFVLSSFKTPYVEASQTSFFADAEDIVVNGTYDGHEDYGYNFIIKNADGDEVTLTFQKVEASVLKSFDLDSEDLLNKKFKVTYSVKIEESIDEDGFKNEEEINTIIKLEKL